MKLTCNQMEILISFYLENELSPSLKQQFNEHLNECESCASKFEIIKTMFTEMKDMVYDECLSSEGDFDIYKTNVHENIFKTKLSEYVDNELSCNENIKIKKLAITNKEARKDLEDSYNIRRLMSDSYKRSKSEAKQDYTKAILKQLELENEAQAEFNPAISLLIIFTITVLVITTIVLLLLNS